MIKLSLSFNIRKSVGTVNAGDSQEKLHSFLNGYKKAHCKSLYPFVNVFFSSQGNFSKLYSNSGMMVKIRVILSMRSKCRKTAMIHKYAHVCRHMNT